MPDRLRPSVIVIAGLMLLLGRPAFAQNAGEVGLSIGYPAAVGLLWQIADRIGVRPELQLDFASTETSTMLPPIGSIEQETDLTQVGIGVSLLLRVYREDNVSVYVSPRYVYARASLSTVQRGLPVIGAPADASFDEAEDGHRISGSIGVHYALGSRVGVFGELGLEHSRRDTGTAAAPSGAITAVSRTTGLRSGLGLVFVF